MAAAEMLDVAPSSSPIGSSKRFQPGHNATFPSDHRANTDFVLDSRSASEATAVMVWTPSGRIWFWQVTEITNRIEAGN
jgi:hypothetical protein